MINLADVFHGYVEEDLRIKDKEEEKAETEARRIQELEDKKSFFRYLENGEIITCYDNKGITIREFNIPRPPNFFWHCVGSKCNRYSFGFKII